MLAWLLWGFELRKVKVALKHFEKVRAKTILSTKERWSFEIRGYHQHNPAAYCEEKHQKTRYEQEIAVSTQNCCFCSLCFCCFSTSSLYQIIWQHLLWYLNVRSTTFLNSFSFPKVFFFFFLGCASLLSQFSRHLLADKVYQVTLTAW